MNRLPLRVRLLLSYLLVVAVLGVFVGFLGYALISSEIVGRQQRQVEVNLKAARAVYESRLADIGQAFSLVRQAGDLSDLQRHLGLDYLYVAERTGLDTHPSRVVREAAKGNAAGATRLVGGPEFGALPEALRRRACIPVRPTPRARGGGPVRLDSALAIEFARPFLDSAGSVIRVLYGGYVVNGRFDLVDRIHSIVYDGEVHGAKPLGTVTVFQRNVRVATNVLDAKGERAVGTQMSDEVYDAVLAAGKPWFGRAFVVTDWYLTAYEPITDMDGQRIGVLYVGTLEKPFVDLRRRMGLYLAGILGGGVVLAAVLAILFSALIARPVRGLLQATARLSGGDLRHRVSLDTPQPSEFQRLSAAFNDMADRLDERESGLRIANEKLATLNKGYLDLIGFVSHELKGVLSSTVLNAYSVRDGYLGQVNERQLKAMAAVTRNLDYLTLTVRRFLDLSRIEKGELEVHPRPIRLREDVFEPSLDVMARQAGERSMRITNDLPAGVEFCGDRDLLHIVANNLVSNAVKYGSDGGEIRICSRQAGASAIEFEVFNTGVPIAADKTPLLFRKFSRLADGPGGKTRGTGLGLFITRQIVEKHGGAIRLEPRADGNAFIVSLPTKAPPNGNAT